MHASAPSSSKHSTAAKWPWNAALCNPVHEEEMKHMAIELSTFIMLNDKNIECNRGNLTRGCRLKRHSLRQEKLRKSRADQERKDHTMTVGVNMEHSYYNWYSTRAKPGISKPSALGLA